MQLMGSRRELLASLAFVGAVVLGFQAIDPLRDQSAGGTAAVYACWMPVDMKTTSVQASMTLCEPWGTLRSAWIDTTIQFAEEEEDGPRSMPSVQYTAEGVIVRRLTTGSAMKVCLSTSFNVHGTQQAHSASSSTGRASPACPCQTFSACVDMGEWHQVAVDTRRSSAALSLGSCCCWTCSQKPCLSCRPAWKLR
jgi:hypothetical protein